MPSFAYVAREASTGREIRNSLDASNEGAAIATLLNRNMLVVSIQEKVARRGKTGFGVPLGRWFRQDLRELARDILSTERGWFRPDAVSRLLDEHEAERADHGHRLWCLLMLELWAREHVDAPVLVAA